MVGYREIPPQNFASRFATRGAIVISPSCFDPHPIQKKVPIITAILLVASLVVCSVAYGQEMTTVFVVPPEAVPAGGTVSVWLIALNAADHPMARTFPAQLDGRVQSGGVDRPVVVTLRNPAEAGEIVIPPGGYARREYVLVVPDGLEGQMLFSAPAIHANAVVLEVRRREAYAKTDETPSAQPPNQPPEEAAGPTAADFFKAHFFGYDPFYFIAGTESPNAKFQISFKYRILNTEGWLAKRYPLLQGFHVAYTQTSLWDWEQASAPFLDSSYKPEFLYSMDRADRGRWGDRIRLDLQAGLLHESNGKGGTDSRSLNQAYFQPTIVFGKQNDLQLSLSPRVWAYVGSLSDNPDIPHYRGYVGLRSILGWADALQLSVTGRLGSSANRGSLQFDLSYPMMRLFSGSFSLYLYAQYFTGYGESLLLYNQRSSAFRAGLAFFR